MFHYVLTHDFMHKVGSALQQPRHTLLPVLQAAALSPKDVQASLAASAQRGQQLASTATTAPAHTRKALE